MYTHAILYVAVAFIALYVFFKRGPKKGKAIPGPTGFPSIGYAHKIINATVQGEFFDLAKKYGGIVHVNSLGQDIIILNNADIARRIFCDEPYKKFTNDRPKIFWSEYIAMQCRGVFATTEAFNSPHGDLRKNFVRGMNIYGDGISAFEATVNAELVKISNQLESFSGKEFDIQPIIKNFLYNVMSILVSGQAIGSDETVKKFWDFDTGTDFLSRPSVNLMLTAIPALRLVPSEYKQVFDDTIRAREALLQRYVHDAKKTFKPGQCRGLVDFYLNEQRLTKKECCCDEQICALVLETIVAGVIGIVRLPAYNPGVITTLSHVSAFFLCMMNYPEYQTKIQEEIARVIGTDNQPSLSDKHDCVFIEAVTMEVHRLITTAPMAGPKLCKHNIEFEGYDIPANSMIFTNLWFIHHDEKVWGDPWTFRPERWIDDDGALLPNDHALRKNFLAFGTGRRQCIGESLARSRSFLLVATLFQRWNFEMLPDYAVSCDPRDGDMTFGVMCRPKPFLCRAVPRKQV